MKNMIIFFAASIAICFGTACKKENAPGKVPYSIRMTDAPGPYSEVNIDLKAVEVTGPNNNVMLNVNAGVYNLLDFANGIDTLIATGSLNAGTVSQVRLILGANNTVKVNGTLYPLKTPSAQQSGLKLQVHQTLEAGVAYSVLLDFDANLSVVDEGNGKYSLKPVVRTVQAAISGSIHGKVSPVAAATITATSGANVYTATTDANGEFLFQGMAAGTYTVTVTPVAPFTASTINNVVVSIGSTTQMGTIGI
jgi:hypothetical protein